MSGGNIEYWTTFYIEGNQSTHLVVGGYDLSICGDSVSGDPMIYSKNPERASGNRVTCSACQLIINGVLEHRKLSTQCPTPNT